MVAVTNEQIIYQAAREQGVPDTVAKLMIAQSKQETGEFTSAVFKDDHNGFGMKVPSVRKDPYIKGPSSHTQLKEGTVPYAAYENLSDSTKSLINWMQYNKIKWEDIDTPEKYATVLKNKGYYGDALATYMYRVSMFYDKIKNVVYKYRTHIDWALATGGVFVLAYGIYMFINRKKLK